MPNRNYEKGRRFEYKVVHEERAEGCIAFRSAGSRSPIDVVSIDDTNKIIRLIQCKDTRDHQKRLKRKFNKNDQYTVIWEVRQK